MKNTERAIAFSVGFVLAHSFSYGYENICTHPQMAENSALLMNGSSGGAYLEFLRNVQGLRAGALNEDVPDSMVFNHFYYVPDGTALNVPGLANLVLNATQCRVSTDPGCTMEDAVTRAKRYRSDAVDKYRRGQKTEAFVVLGRAMHLLEDLHQPAHVHNDAHVTKQGVILSSIAKLDGHDLSTIEEYAEIRCATNPNYIPAGVVVRQAPSGDPADIIIEGAQETFSLALSSGGGVSSPSSARVVDNSDIEIDQEDGIKGSNKCLSVRHWILRDNVTNNRLCFSDFIKQEGTIADHFDNDWWEVYAGPRRRLVPENKFYFYIDRYEQVATGRLNQGGSAELLEEYYSNNRLAPAVERGAAYLKMFAGSVDDVAPRFIGMLAGLPPNEKPFHDGETIDQDHISVMVEDPIALLRSPVPSGIYRLELVDLTNPAHPLSPETPLSSDGEGGLITRTFSGLADKEYELKAYDGLGNIGITHFTVDKAGGSKPVPPTDPDPNNPPSPPLPPPDPDKGIEIDANTGEYGQACAGPSASGHKPVCVRTQVGGEQCYPEPIDPLCVTWACSSPGNYDIPINFQDDRGNWARTHTIHCHDVPPKTKVCTPGQDCHEVSLPPNFDLANSTITAVIEEGGPYCGGGDACQMIERIGGGKCEIVGFGGCSAIRYSREYPHALVAAAGMFYFPPETRDYLRHEPFTIHFGLNGTDLGSFTYPEHNSRGATVRLPMLKQPWKNCADDGQTCLASGGSGGGGGGGGNGPPWGDGPPPTPQPNPPPAPAQPGVPAPPPDPEHQAAAAMGRGMLGGTIRIGNAATIFGAPLKLTGSASVPPYQPTTGAEICRWTGTTWGCEGSAAVSCTGGTCAMSADLLHASTWAFLAPLPSFYPDLTAPNLTEIQISEDNLVWSTPGALIQTSNPSVRMTARDPPSGVELISGLAVSSVPLPFVSSDLALILHLHLDEGSGSQLFDSGPYRSTGVINLTPAWVAGRFGSALEFNAAGGQQASAPVNTRVDSGPFSIEAWVYPTDDSGNHGIAGKGTAFNRFFGLQTSNGRLLGSVGDGSVGYTVTSGDSLPLNTWSLVGMSFDGTKLRIYANGEQKGEIAAAYSGSDSTVVIGSLWKGRLDEVRILNRALSRAESALDYRRGFAALATGDGGNTWRMASQYAYGGASEGQHGPSILTASGFALARSTYAVSIELAVADVDGHFTSASFQLPVAPADTTPLTFSGAEISTNTSVWYPQGAIPRPGAASFRVKVQDPALGSALRSGVATSTQTIPFAPNPDTLILLHLDEGSGVPLDSSPRASVVSMQNGPAWVAGRFGGALEFSSDYQYLVPSASPAGLDVANWTVNVWVYPTSTANGAIISKGNDANHGFILWKTGGLPEVSVSNTANGPGAAVATGPDPLPLNQWTALTATCDQSVIRLYVNGVLKASAPGHMDPNSASFVIAAANGNPPFWRGRLDEVRFLSRAQSPAEVLLDYRRGYAALFSSDAGANWSAPSLSYGAAIDGDLNAVLSVSSLTLANSLTSNQLQLFAADAAGNSTSTVYVLPAAVDATAPGQPVVVSTQLAGGGVAIAWQQAAGEVPVSYSLYRATEPIGSLAGMLPIATTSALSALDAPASGDILYYALTATDLQGNVGSPSASVQTRFDRLPPVTTLGVIGASSTISGIVYTLPSSTLTLSALDQGAAISGVAAVNLTVDGVPASAPFRLAQGVHQLSYFATDAAGNVEAPRTSTVTVDATPPVSTFTVAGGASLDSLDRAIIVAGQTVILAAQDAGAGVSRILYRVDAGSWGVAAVPVTIAEGQHVLEFYAEDVLGNAEPVRSQAFVVALAPTNGVSVADPTANTFTVLWSSMTNASGYVVLVSSASDFSTVVFSTAIEAQQVVVTGLEPSTTYFVRVAFFSDSNDGLPVTVTAATARFALTSIGLTPAAISVYPGETTQFAAQGTFSDGSTRALASSEIAWSTDASSVAAVSAFGLASGLAVGNAHIVASSDSVIGRADFMVIARPIDHVAPTMSDFASLSGTSELAENEINSSTGPVGARVYARDVAPGLALSSGAVAFSGDGHDGAGTTGGYGVMYTTTAGRNWIDFSTVSVASLVAPGRGAVSQAVFNGKLYAGVAGTGAGGGGVYESADGVNWTRVLAAGSSVVNFAAMSVFKGKLYVGYDDQSYTAKVYATSNGTSWTQVLSDVTSYGGNAVSMAVFDGALYMGTDDIGLIYRTVDGSSWTAVVNGYEEFNHVFVIYSLVPFNGRLYAGTAQAGRILSSADGISWSQSAVINSQGFVYALAVMNRNLYASVLISPNSYVYRSTDGTNWIPTNYPAQPATVQAFAAFGGELYAGTNSGAGLYASPDGWNWLPVGAAANPLINSLIAFGGSLYAGVNKGVMKLSPLAAALTGTDGTTSTQTLTASGLALAASTNVEVCGGVYPCGATNQVWFAASDLAGNSGNSGPRSVLVDAAPPAFGALEVSEDGEAYGPASTRIVGVSSASVRVTVQAPIAGLDPASVTASVSNDHGATWTVVSATNVTVAATGASTAPYVLIAAAVNLTSSLTSNQVSFSAANLGGKVGYASATVMALLPVTPLVSDRVPPSIADFSSLDGSAAISESETNTSTGAIGARVSVRDAAPGLALSTGAIAFAGDGHDGVGTAGGYGVIYSTTAGRDWIDFSTVTTTLLVAPGRGAVSQATFQGKLYAGVAGTGAGGGGVYESADGVSWNRVLAAGGSVVNFAAMSVYNGKLYVGYDDRSNTVKVYATANGTSWTQVLSDITSDGGNAVSMAVFNGGLYLGTDGAGLVYATTDGSTWKVVLNGHEEFNRVFVIYSLVPFNGRLYAGTAQAGRILSSADGAHWSQSAVINNGGFTQEGHVYALAVLGSDLYASILLPPNSYVYRSSDGTNWIPTNYPAQPATVLSFAAFGGKLYAGTNSGAGLYASPDGRNWLSVGAAANPLINSLTAFGGELYAGVNNGVKRLTPLVAALTGTDGATSTQTLTASGLTLAASTNAEVCGGIHPCGATNQVWFTASDLAGNSGSSGPRAVLISTGVTTSDDQPPLVTAAFSAPSFTAASGAVTMATGAAVSLSAVDQASGTTPSGVASILYSIDAATPTTAYSAPFQLAAGTHTLYYTASDLAGNRAAVSSAPVAVTAGPVIVSVMPSSAAIGVPITIAGFNFRARNVAKSLILFDSSTGTITSWNDTTIVGKVPGLSSRTYALSVVALDVSTRASAGVNFDVVAPRLDSIAPSAGPAGITAFLYGGNFGPLDGTRTRVLFAGATAQINTWNDSVIKIDVPAASTGAVAVQVERQSLDGATVRSNTLFFTMEGMILTAVTPSTGPVGRIITMTGSDFGPIDGANTRVRVGPSTGTVITWTDTQVTAAVPFLDTGTYPLSLERVSAASTTVSTFLSFELTPLVVGSIDQSSGPIGTILTVTGTGYGANDAARTRVVWDGSVAAHTTWNDTTIVFRVPGSTDGAHAFHLERQARNGGVQRSDDGYFTVAMPQLYSVSPSSAPIGQAGVILTGLGFGAKDGTRTRVMFGSVSAAVATWTDASAKVTVPPSLSTGPCALTVERDSLDGMTVFSSSLTFTVLRPTIATMTPSFGLANALITMTGYGFGASLGSKSHVLLNGATVQFTTWNDTMIKWKVPSGVANGTYTVVAVRQPTGGYVESNAAPFTVGSFALASFAAAAPASLAAQPDQNFEAGMSLPADEGGRVESVALAAVDVPAGALGEDTELTIKRLRTDGLRTAAADAAKVRAAGEPIEYGPEGTRFNVPVTIELPYDPALAGDASKLAVHYYDPLRRVWTELPSVVDRARRVVSARTDHFSIYQPMGLAPTTVAQDEFYYRDQYAFPNPSRGGVSVTFRIQPGLAETVEVRVYDLAGRKIHDSSDFTFLGAFDDGNGKGAQDTYDHVWSVGGVGSGVYSYVIKASRGGQKPIIKSGKVGVIK